MIEVVGAFLVRNGDVLLGRRAGHKSFPGCWDVIGGHVETGETPENTLQRELLEEVGVTAKRALLFDVIGLTIPDEGCVRMFAYLVSEWSGTLSFVNDEHTDLQWFSLAEASSLPELPSPEYRRLFNALASTVSFDRLPRRTL